MPQTQVVNLIFLLGSRASQMRKVLTLHRAHPPARADNLLLAHVHVQEALLPLFESSADLAAADKAMHLGDPQFGDMVSSAPAKQTDASARLTIVWRGRTGGERDSPSQLDPVHAHHASACSQAQRLWSELRGRLPLLRQHDG